MKKFLFVTVYNFVIQYSCILLVLFYICIYIILLCIIFILYASIDSRVKHIPIPSKDQLPSDIA